MDANPRSTARGLGFALAAYAVFSTHDAIIKYLGEVYAPFQILFFSVLLSFPLATIMLMSDRTEANLQPVHPWWTAARTVSVVITGGSAFYAFSHLPLADAYAILFAAPLLITLLAIPFLGERVGLHRMGAVVVGLAGVMIVLRPGSTELTLGHFAAMTAAVGAAVTAVIVRKIGSDERSAVLMLYPIMANFVVMGGLLPAVYQPMPIEHLGLLALMAMLGFAGMYFIIVAYRNAEAVLVAPMQYSQMIWAAVYGAIVFGEEPDTTTWVGASVIILSGVYIVLREASGTSLLRPVSQSKQRPETGSTPRLAAYFRLFGRRH